MIDRARLDPRFLAWLDACDGATQRAVEAQAQAIAEADALNDSVRRRDYWRRSELVTWCEANQGYRR